MKKALNVTILEFLDEDASSIDDCLQGVDAQIADTEEYLRTKADVMLLLYISTENSGMRSLYLKRREKPVYREKGLEIDILEQSGIHVPELQETGRFYCQDTAQNTPGMVQFDGHFCADRDGLIQAMHTLFSRIRIYESQKIDHPAGYHASGAGRNAHVSVTGMEMLKRFNMPNLQRLPDIYLTTDAQSEMIILPPMTNGTVIRIPRFTNQN